MKKAGLRSTLWTIFHPRLAVRQYNEVFRGMQNGAAEIRTLERAFDGLQSKFAEFVHHIDGKVIVCDPDKIRQATFSLDVQQAMLDHHKAILRHSRPVTLIVENKPTFKVDL